MNRLTQKIIKHLLYITNQDLTFGKFMIGVLFGENFKKYFELNGLTDLEKKEKINFKLYVTNHLIQAEELEEKTHIKNLNLNSSLKCIKQKIKTIETLDDHDNCLLYTSPSPRD